jgi:alkylation response protein AidB-like acyl-CoA dehydrogenase
LKSESEIQGDGVFPFANCFFGGAFVLSNEELIKRGAELAGTVIAARADEIDRQRQFPRENLKELGKAGLLGLLVPKEFGGAGLGISEMAQTLEPLAQACPSTAMVTLMHYSATAVIVAKGSEGLRQKFLPSIARGEHLSTLAFSEAGSGGHFYLPVSQAARNGQGLTLSASKSFVTSAGEADSYIVSTRTANAAGPLESDLYLVPSGASGLQVQGRFEGLGLAGNASAPMKLQNVAVRDEDRLGEEGSGFATMMQVMLPHFQIGMAAVSLGIAAAAFDAATAHVTGRKYEHVGGQSLSAIPRVQYLAAEMAVELRSARAYLHETIQRATTGHPEAMLDILAVKVRATDAALAVTSRAMTLGGGAAFGRHGGLERIFRDAQAAAVMAPASDILKEFLGKACLGVPLY